MRLARDFREGQRKLLRHIRREVEQQRRVVPSDVPLVALRHTAIGTTTTFEVSISQRAQCGL